MQTIDTGEHTATHAEAERPRAEAALPPRSQAPAVQATSKVSVMCTAL